MARTSALIRTSAQTKTSAHTGTSGQHSPFDCAAALFSYDFVAGGVDYDTLESLHRGEVSEWASALRRSGMFTDAEMDAIGTLWSERPGLLLDALLRDADEVTVRRCRLAWASMDRLAPFQMPIAHSG